jgi:hypothetical protein
MLQIKQAKDKDKLQAKHEKQKQELIKEINNVRFNVTQFKLDLLLLSFHIILDIRSVHFSFWRCTRTRRSSTS